MPAPVISASPSAPAGRQHILALLLALCVLTAAAMGGTFWGTRLEHRYFAALLPLFADPHEHEEARNGLAYIEHLKNQGVVLQRVAFERKDILPLYGSSELVKRIPDKASLFFQREPSGFSVLNVGKAGTTSLLMLQKIAALGPLPEGKRVAISVSPSWFFTDLPEAHAYRGNFSRQQAFASLLNRGLSFGFRRDLAQRLLQHPASLEDDRLLKFISVHLASSRPLDRALYAVTWPLAQLQRALYTAQDHFEAGLFIWTHPHHLAKAPEPKPRTLDWDALIASASNQSNTEPSPEDRRAPPRRIRTEEGFREQLNKAEEWQDLELLLRGLHELGVHTLVLSMPPNGAYFERGGVGKETLDLFGARIRDLAARWGAQVEAFEDHEDDLNFMVDHHDHMSAKGWMYYNRALDEFYHTDLAELDRAFAKGHRKRAHAPPRFGRS